MYKKCLSFIVIITLDKKYSDDIYLVHSFLFIVSVKGYKKYEQRLTGMSL